jgi:ankyrin repeat protein
MENGQIDKDRALHAAFFEAARTGQFKVVELLLQAGASIHEQQDLALRTASEFGQTEMVRFLLEQGADVHAKYDQAQLLARANGHKATAAFLAQWMGNAGHGPHPAAQ